MQQTLLPPWLLKTHTDSNGFTYRLEGSPNIRDEPQHKMMGRITLNMMKLFDIKTVV